MNRKKIGGGVLALGVLVVVGFLVSGPVKAASLAASAGSGGVVCPGGATPVNGVCPPLPTPPATPPVTNPYPSVPTAKLTASATSIYSGGAVTLTWSSTNATYCSGTGFSTASSGGTAPTSGSTTVHPTQNTTYSLKCGNSGTAIAIKSVTVTVTPGTACPGGATPVNGVCPPLPTH